MYAILKKEVIKGWQISVLLLPEFRGKGAYQNLKINDESWDCTKTKVMLTPRFGRKYNQKFYVTAYNNAKTRTNRNKRQILLKK